MGKAIRTKADLIITICRQWGMTFGQEMPVQLRCPSTFPHPFLVLFLLTAHYLPPPDLLYSHPFSRSFQRGVGLESAFRVELSETTGHVFFQLDAVSQRVEIIFVSFILLNYEKLICRPNASTL